MSRISTILITGLYVFTLLQAYVPHVNYWMNREYVATVLCENLDSPELKCEGKCHLKKDIRQSESEQKDAQAESVRSMVEYFHPIAIFSFKNFVSEGKKASFNYVEKAIFEYSSSIFRPPKP
ncbi:MAG: hypothetical protein K9J17_03430 [Flavobacteriales bacterium]|nr:hypothetical protein [Flavobacteriales bacterium]